MNKERIERIALELAEELGESYSIFDKEFVLDPIHFAIRFLTKVDAERVKKEPVAWLVSSRGVFNTHADALQNWKYNGQRKDEVPEPLFLHPQPIHEGYKPPAGLAEILEEAADILYQDKPMRYPIVDELRRFASMLAEALEVKP